LTEFKVFEEDEKIVHVLFLAVVIPYVPGAPHFYPAHSR